MEERPLERIGADDILRHRRTVTGKVIPRTPRPSLVEGKTLPLEDLLRLIDEGGRIWSEPTIRISEEVVMLEAAEGGLVERTAQLAQQLDALATSMHTQALREELGLGTGYTEARAKQRTAEERHLRATQALDALRTRLETILPRALSSTMAADIVEAHRQSVQDVEEFKARFLATFNTPQQEYGTPSLVSRAWIEVCGKHGRLATLRAKFLGERPPPPYAPALIGPSDVRHLQRPDGGKPDEETLEMLTMWAGRL